MLFQQMYILSIKTDFKREGRKVMWSAELPESYETRKCMHRVMPLVRGLGLDINPQKDKLTKETIGVGLSPKADIKMDITANDSLGIFSNDYFDYVFAAGQLGNFVETEAVLREWWRVLRYDGNLIIYEPDADFYPRVGTPGCSEHRKKNLYWEDAWKIIKGFGNAELVSHSRHNDGNEYSWQLVVRKTFSVLSKPFESLGNKPVYDSICLPRKKKAEKEALVIRFGALGDTIWLTPVLKQLKEDGYYVAVNCTERGAQVLKECKWVDEFIILQNSDSIDYFQLDDFWQMLGESFDKVVNLTKSVEGSLIKVEGSDEFKWPHEKRHKECNINFQDRQMELAGYPEMKGCLPELHFTDIEESLAKNFRAYYEGKFMVLWGLAGSAFHKVYPWSEYVAKEFAANHNDVLVITVGDNDCKILEWQNPRTLNKSGVWTVRQSFIMTKYADCVIGPDTGLLNAASCYDTPKIIFQSANSKENLTKYWKNCTDLYAEDCECYPCHRLIYSKDFCPKGTYQGVAAKCMENIKPEVVLEALEAEYSKWQVEQLKKQNEKKFVAFTVADDDFTHRLAMRTKKSFEYFNPDVPFIIYDSRDEKKIFGSVRIPVSCNPNFAIRPRLIKKLLGSYDGVIHLDADTVVTAPLNEMLAGDYDVAGSLNISDNEDDRYCNAGVCAVTRSKFAEEWTEAVYDKRCPPTNQVSFNELANKYNFKILDESDVYYNERSRKYWKQLHCVNSHLECNNRIVKVLHWAGGVERMEDKISSKDFNAETREFLNKVTDTKDFTENIGSEVSKW